MKIEEYLKMPYTYQIRKIDDESGSYYYGTVAELDGCQSSGETFDEAYENLTEAMEGYIEFKLEKGFEVPVPQNIEEYSGKFLLRIPKSLHSKLALAAKNEGVSLNQYALYKLSQ